MSTPRINGNSKTLESLQEKKRRIQAQIDAIATKEKEKLRKEDTRLKVLVGAAFITDAERNEATKQNIRAVVDRAITAPRDREFLKEKGWLSGG